MTTKETLLTLIRDVQARATGESGVISSRVELRLGQGASFPQMDFGYGFHQRNNVIFWRAEGDFSEMENEAAVDEFLKILGWE